MTAKSTMIARPIKSTMIARPIKSTMIVGSKRAPVIVATPPIPVIAPARVPKVAWAPLRERPGLGLSVSCNAQPCQPQAGDQCKSRCSQTQIIFHRLTMYPCNPYRNIDARVSSWQSPANSLPRSEPRGFECRGALGHFWQVGHRNTFRPSSTAVRIGPPLTRHGFAGRAQPRQTTLMFSRITLTSWWIGQRRPGRWIHRMYNAGWQSIKAPNIVTVCAATIVG